MEISVKMNITQFKCVAMPKEEYCVVIRAVNEEGGNSEFAVSLSLDQALEFMKIYGSGQTTMAVTYQIG